MVCKKGIMVCAVQKSYTRTSIYLLYILFKNLLRGQRSLILCGSTAFKVTFLGA